MIAHARRWLVWFSLLFALPAAAEIDRRGLRHQRWASHSVNADVRRASSWVRLSHSAVLLPHELPIRSSPLLNAYCPQSHTYGDCPAHDGEEWSPSTSAVAWLTALRGGGGAVSLMGALLRTLWQNPLLVLREYLFQ
jgi:hypothetical protein